MDSDEDSLSDSEFDSVDQSGMHSTINQHNKTVTYEKRIDSIQISFPEHVYSIQEIRDLHHTSIHPTIADITYVSLILL